MEGYELIKAIEKEGLDNCKVKYKRPWEEGIIEIKEKGLVWKPGTFSTKYLTDGFTEFEVIEEQQDIDIQKIEGLRGVATFNTSETIKNHFDKINELVQAVKQLDKKIKEQNNG